MEEEMSIEQLSVVRPPVAERILTKYYLGKVDDDDKDQIRGLDESKLIDPPIEILYINNTYFQYHFDNK